MTKVFRCAVHAALILAAAVAMLVLALGCGRGKMDAHSDADTRQLDVSDVDPCTLVTPEEAEAVLDGPLLEQERPVEANIESRLATCRYVVERGPSVAVLVVMIRGSVEPGGADIAFQSQRQAPIASETVSGIGDDALWSEELGLTVLTGDLLLTISGDVTFEQARALAEGAIRRLG